MHPFRIASSALGAAAVFSSVCSAQEGGAPDPARPAPVEVAAVDPGFQDEELPETRVVARATDLLVSDSMASEMLSDQVFTVERNVRQLPDALLESAGVGLQRTGPAQGSPFIRGFTGFRTLMTIDGFRLNHSAWRDGPNQYLGTVDPELLESIEVRYGTHNVRSGTDAIGGSVILRSHEPGSFLPDRDHSAELALRLSSADQGLAVHGAAGGRFDDFEYRVGVTRRHFGDLSGGRHTGLQDGTDFDTLAADAKLAWNLGEGRRLVLAHQRDVMADAPRTHSTVRGISYRGTTMGSDRKRELDQTRTLSYVKLEWTDEEIFQRGEIGLGRHVHTEARSRIRSDFRRDEQGFDVAVNSLFTSVESDTSAGLLRGGFDVNLEDVDSFRRDFDADGTFRRSAIQGPVADDARYDAFGAYLEDEIGLGETTWLTGGARISHARYDADKVQDPATGNRISLDDQFTTWSAELRLLQQLGEHDEVYAAVSRTSRLPNLSDTTRLDSARSGEIETPSPGLDPEDFLTYEVGARHRQQTWSAGAAAYWTRIEDLIVRFPTGAVIDGATEVQKANLGDGHVAGVDLRASWNFQPAWTVAADLSYVSGMVENFVSPGVVDDEPVSRLPPLHSHLRLRWDDPESTVWVEGVATFAAEADRLAERDIADRDRIPPGGTPGYSVFTLRGGVSPTEHLDLSLILENLTDRDYRLHGSGINEPGLNAIFGVRYRF